jgi:hypothetical protein
MDSRRSRVPAGFVSQRERDRYLCAMLLVRLARAGHLSAAVSQVMPVAEQVIGEFPDDPAMEAAARLVGGEECS